jgi:hypothetical protein
MRFLLTCLACRRSRSANCTTIAWSPAPDNKDLIVGWRTRRKDFFLEMPPNGPINSSPRRQPNDQHFKTLICRDELN